MADAISSANGSPDRVMGTGNTYNAVFTDEGDNSILDPDQFLNLMIVQMQNQDFMNPMDDTSYITQMVQFSNMQQMQQMAEYSKTGYALSLVGKTVTASRINVSGDLDTTTGVVDKVSLVDNEYVIYVDGKKYTLSQIMSVETGSDDEEAAVDASQLELEKKDVTANSVQFSWPVPTEDETVASGLKYTVYYSENGPFDSLEEVEKGTSFGLSKTGETDCEVTGLKPDTTYYINVVVEDAQGKKTLYKPLMVKTLSA